MNLYKSQIILHYKLKTLQTERFTSSFSYKDTTKPVITSIISRTNSNTANTVIVKFSEPIQSLGTVKINNSVKSATGFSPGDDEARFTGLSLNASQSHDLQIINLRDQASNISSIINETFSITVDTVAPKVTLSASSDKDNVILLKFDKPITTTSANLVLVNGIVKNESLGNQTSGNAIAINPVNGLATDYELAVTAPFGTLSTRNLTVLIPSGIKDDLGNEVVNTTKTVTLKKDTTRPEIDLVRFIKDSNDNIISLVISTDSTLSAKASVNAATLASSLTVVDPDGVLVPSSTWLGGISQNAIAAGAKKITLPFATPGKLSGEYEVTFAAGLATDEADTPNTLKSETVTIDFGPATSTGTFTILPGNVSSGGTNIYDVYFGAAVKGGNIAGSATDKNNYTLNGSVLTTGTTITLNTSKDIARITLPAESIATSDSGAVFTIDNVQRLTGETIVPFTTTVNAVDNTKPVMTSTTLTNDNRLVVGFSEALAATPTSSDFRIKINGKSVATTPTFVPGTGTDAGKYIVDLNPLILNNTIESFIDIDGSGIYNSANDILIATEATLSPFSMKTSPITSSLTIETIGGATTDNAANNLKIGTMITAKP